MLSTSEPLPFAMDLDTALDYVAGVCTAVLACAGLVATPAGAQEAAMTAEPRVIEITARRFRFEPSRVEVEKGEKVRLVLRSADGVHGFCIRKFKVTEEIPRGGEPVSIEFTATAAGEFAIVCSEVCGKGHEDMKGLLVVKARAKGAHR